MRISRLAPWVAVLAVLSGCRERPPARATDAANRLAELAVDSNQARLWRDAATSGAAEGIERLQVDSAAVRKPAAAAVSDRPAPQQRTPFPESVDAAFVMRASPGLPGPFSGPVRVDSVEGEFVTLAVGEGGTIQFQAKVAGGSIRAQPGQQGQLFFREGEVFRRNDVLALRLPGDGLVHALVGGDTLVEFTVPPFQLSVQQVGPVEKNTAPVRVAVGKEVKLMRPDEQADFRTASLTIKVLASVAVQGEAANALPGRPYRVELLGWQTRKPGT